MDAACRAPMSRLSSAFSHHQIVAMNDLIATTVPEDVCNFTTLVACNATDIGARIGRKAATELSARASPDDNRVAALKNTFDRDHASRQKARAAPERCGGAVIDNYCAGWTDRACVPRLARRPRLSARHEQGRSVARLDRSERPRQGACAFPLGDQHATAGTRRNAGSGELCHHPARAVAWRRLAGHRFDLRSD